MPEQEALSCPAAVPFGSRPSAEEFLSARKRQAPCAQSAEGSERHSEAGAHAFGSTRAVQESDVPHDMAGGMLLRVLRDGAGGYAARVFRTPISREREQRSARYVESLRVCEKAGVPVCCRYA